MVKRETTLTFYGGVNEIGGNKILIKDGDTRVFFDFGMSFNAKKQFYSAPFLSPKTEKSLQELGILPKIEGIYEFDAKTPQIDAIFISHAHLDHSAYISFINRKIPVYCGETTQTIMQATSQMRRTDLEFNIENLAFKSFRTGNKITIGNLQIEPVHVDHSVPGAYGFIIQTSNGAIAYTGDFRLHGAKPKMTSDFINKTREAEPAAVITEATNMIGASVSSENEVENKLSQIVRQTDGIVLAEFAYADVDRLNTFFYIAKNSGRCLAVSLKQAWLMEALKEDKNLNLPSLDDENMLIFQKTKATSQKWEKQILTKYSEKVVDTANVAKQQCKTILALSFYDFEQLVEIQPDAGSCYVLSASEPFNEEMEIDYEKLVNWLSHYGIPQYHVHVSGHIMPIQLKEALQTINADKIFPIHTEHAALFSKFMRDAKGKTQLVETGEEYKI
ncbi:MAG: MBL fold metallo-hydrolase [Candidatus Bathyarchaeia archaeon]